MKKKTVITTEKREVWVVREAVSEPDLPIDVSNVTDSPPDGNFEIPEEIPAEE